MQIVQQFLSGNILWEHFLVSLLIFLKKYISKL